MNRNIFALQLRANRPYGLQHPTSFLVKMFMWFGIVDLRNVFSWQFPIDSGLTWKEAQQIKDVEDTGVIDTPYNLNVAAANNKVLIMWQAGQPGTTKCDVLSQWSENNGRSWGDVISVLEGRGACPVSSNFIVQKEDYIVALLTGQIDPTW